MMASRHLQADDDDLGPIDEPIPVAGIKVYNDSDGGSEVPTSDQREVTEKLEEDQQVTGERYGYHNLKMKSNPLTTRSMSIYLSSRHRIVPFKSFCWARMLLICESPTLLQKVSVIEAQNLLNWMG